MSVFFTDSCCAILYDEIKKLGIEYIPMPYIIDGEEKYYHMGKDYDCHEFFEKIRSGATCTTSALSPQGYIDIFEPVLQANEDIVYVHFSHKLSGTFNFMNQAIEELKVKYPNRTIKTVDTLNISMGAGFIVYEAAIMHKRGATDDEIIEFVKKFRHETGTYFVVDDLFHLKRGGRLSAASAVVGSMLGIKPMLVVTDEGTIIACDKPIGRKKSLLALVDKVKKLGENVVDYPIYVMQADCEADGEFVKNKILEAYPEARVNVQKVGPVIGSHCGPNTVGIIFHAKKRM